MGLHKQIAVACFIALGFGLALWGLWPNSPYVASVRLPEGVSLAEALRVGKSGPPKGWSTNIYCQGSSGMRFNRDLSGLVERIRYGVHEVSGRTLYRAPNPPRPDYVTPRLGECYQISGEKYLLAKEFVWEVDQPEGQRPDFTFLGFVWGATNQLRRARDIVSVTEDGILKDGIFGKRLKWSLPQQRGVMSTEYLPTNRCAIIRDVKGLVKIVPIEYLKAYADAGLVMLTTRE